MEWAERSRDDEMVESISGDKRCPAVPRKSSGGAPMKQPILRRGPWVEKYRPKKLEDVVGNEEALRRLMVIAEDGEMPNVLLCGPPGTGKTTSILCLARTMLGDAYNDAVLELNASDTRGIEMAKGVVEKFAQKQVRLPPGRHKLVVLDEADSMTAGAQQALRRTMEAYTSTTRFALACNDPSQIVDPIQSRCAQITFARLSDKYLYRRLKEIAHAEEVRYEEQGIEAIVFTAEGDMRQAINNLQAVHTGYGLVTLDNVFRVCDKPHPLEIQRVLRYCLSGDLDAGIAGIHCLHNQGHSMSDIVQTLFKVVKILPEIPEDLKLDIIAEIGESHLRMTKGVSGPLQLASIAARTYGLRHEFSHAAHG